MSPSAAAPRSASQMAWARASPSEWPTGPISKDISTPPRTNLRPLARRWMSSQVPIRSDVVRGCFFRGITGRWAGSESFPGISGASFGALRSLPLLGDVEAGQGQVRRLGNLDIPVGAHEDCHRVIQAFD